jgi:hypothetical protein
MPKLIDVELHLTVIWGNTVHYRVYCKTHEVYAHTDANGPIISLIEGIMGKETDFHSNPCQENVDLYIHAPTRLHGVVLK